MMKFTIKFLAVFVLATVALLAHGGNAHAYTNSRLIDNYVFDNTSTMSQADIQNFLNARNSTCLKNYTSVNGSWNGSSWSFTGNVPASKIIYDAAQFWGINPQVILATLQKEQTLITGTSCPSWRYNSAMGYACPDSGGLYDYPDIGVYQTCVNNKNYAGFSRQVWWGAFQLKFNKERAIGNVNWGDNGSLTYVGYMTQGTYRRSASGPLTYYSGYATIDGQSIYLENGATASLYSYTPHLGQSFPGIFESWFGSTYGDGAIVSQATCSTQQNVYRFWSKRFNDAHFFTSSEIEKNALLNDRNWMYEGVGMCAVTAPQANYVPVYRYWSPRFGNLHFFTTSEIEKNALASDRNWAYEGVAFYVPANQTVEPSAVAIARYWSPKFNNDHFFTGSQLEKNALSGDRNWIYEGTGWYAQMPQ